MTVTNRYCITALERGEEDRKRLEVYNFKEGLEVSGSAGRYFDSGGCSCSIVDSRSPKISITQGVTPSGGFPKRSLHCYYRIDTFKDEKNCHSKRSVTVTSVSGEPC